MRVTPQELRDRAALLRQWGQFELGMTPPAALDYQDTMLKLDLAAAELDRMKSERLVLDRRIHNQRVSLRQNWEIIEMRAQYKRAWYPSKLLMQILKRTCRAQE